MARMIESPDGEKSYKIYSKSIALPGGNLDIQNR